MKYICDQIMARCIFYNYGSKCFNLNTYYEDMYCESATILTQI